MWTDSILKQFRIKVAGEDEKTPEEIEAERLAAEKAKKDDDEEEDDEEDDDEDDDRPDLESLDDKTKKYIKKLRGENAKRRTDHNVMTSKMEKWEKGLKSMFGDDEDETPPEQKLEAMSGQYESAVTENAILKLALENGITGAENVEYFEFQMGKILGSLEEGEEMTEEQLDEVLAKCSRSGGKANTSTKDSGKGGKGPEKKDGETTQAEFDKMGISQKSLLYGKSPELYNKLMANSSVR